MPELWAGVDIGKEHHPRDCGRITGNLRRPKSYHRGLLVAQLEAESATRT